MRGILQILYRWIIERRNRQFDEGKRPVVQVTKPVVSVGNITVGGTGKSPMVQMLVGMFINQGMRPAIVLRGYRRRSKGLVVVHDGVNMLASVDEAGDEAFMHASMLGIPVVVSSDKVEAAAYAAGNLPCDVIIVDDGFQHRALYRATDIVLVNDETFRSELLPRGRLREPVSALGRATIIVCTSDEQRQLVAPLVSPQTLVVLSDIEFECAAPPATPVILVCGIANPHRMKNSLETAGYTVVREFFFHDHHRYRTNDIWKIRDAAASHKAQVVTTNKDIAKIRAIDTSNDLDTTSIHVANISMKIDDPAFTARILQDISHEDRNLEE